jgi:PEGA domain
MKPLLGPSDWFARFLLRLLAMCLLASPFGSPSRAQSAAESAGASSVASATTASQPNQPKPNGSTAPRNVVGEPTKPQHVAAPSGPPPEVLNRQALEQHAGKNACKLLLRSTPNAAQIYVDGAFVGESPLLLIVPPGRYQIEMRGHRLEFGERAVDLLPRETREVALSLTSRYPTRVAVH